MLGKRDVQIIQPFTVSFPFHFQLFVNLLHVLKLVFSINLHHKSIHFIKQKMDWKMKDKEETSITEPLMHVTHPQFSSAFRSQIWLFPEHLCADQLAALNGKILPIYCIALYSPGKTRMTNSDSNYVIHTFEQKDC